MSEHTSDRELFSSLRREKNVHYIVLYLFTILLFFLLLGVKLWMTKEFILEDFISDIIGNLVGAIPPILIYDIVYQKLSSESEALASTKRVTEAIMSNPDTMALFTPEQRKTFLRSNIASFHANPDIQDMLDNRMTSYLSGEAYTAIRTRFNYDFELSTALPAHLSSYLVDPSRYYYMQQKLYYTVTYMPNAERRLLGSTFYISFPLDTATLDKRFRDESGGETQRVIFREALQLLDKDAQNLRDAFANSLTTAEERIDFFMSIISLNVMVDMERAHIADVIMESDGLLVVCTLEKFVADTPDNPQPHNVRIIFHMPRRWNEGLEIILVDPTRAPKISVSYPEDAMDVEMIPFLSSGQEASVANAQGGGNGIFDVSINTEWMYPVSGVVFTVSRESDRY